ncbi:hypothetical protein BCR37DRAFT_394539 [Protomyces lactucae-debilis]|uniref:Uncharacterized protein n=1 Tax=Protomyces lactucae-debilis TaxID=2754530 RepID=A0A1Y2F3W2_PROLT|nr:uncharacterized protein BCR37DRAFT_394539 [Protomyces lactucae-debilis]ORY78598.1 hypothetical protein BCR37DRAFT_394539 [Protomyces lactucae-debilis]
MKQQKTETAKSSGTSIGLQSPPVANLSIMEGVAINRHARPATKALPSDHVSIETLMKKTSQQESSHGSHDEQRVTSLEGELEQMQERLAGILYEQGKKHQAEMEQLEARLSRSYQLQLEGLEARLEARNQECQTRSLKKFDAKLLEAKLLATSRDAIASASISMRNETYKGTQATV